jgi:hypothetical protein
MNILFRLGSERELDVKLEELLAPVIESVHAEPEIPEIQETLRGMYIQRGNDPRDVNAQCLRSSDGRTVLHIGRGLYGFICYYTRCVAAKLLSTGSGDMRPSAAWSVALSSIGTALEWLALPVREVRLPSFDLSLSQDTTALIFGNMAYRAAICHEIAHAVLGHLDAEQREREIDSEEAGQRLINARNRELEADRFAMQLHVESLPHPDMFVTGLASVAYYIHATSLLRLKFMMLSRLIAIDSWTSKGRHPDPLLRIASLAGAAKSLYGETMSEGLMMVHSDLEQIAGDIRQSHFDQRDRTRHDAEYLLNSLPSNEPTISPEEFNSHITELLDRSPIAVVEVLDGVLCNVSLDATRDAVLSALPRPFQRFLALGRDQRTTRALNRVP